MNAMWVEQCPQALASRHVSGDFIQERLRSKLWAWDSSGIQQFHLRMFSSSLTRILTEEYSTLDIHNISYDMLTRPVTHIQCSECLLRKNKSFI